MNPYRGFVVALRVVTENVVTDRRTHKPSTITLAAHCEPRVNKVVRQRRVGHHYNLFMMMR